MRLFLHCIVAIIPVVLPAGGYAQYGSDSITAPRLSRWAFEALKIPKLTPPAGKEILIAVIDDGFMLSHNSIRDFIYTNTAEIPSNMTDDDQNGFIDDYRGWDVSDHDGDVRVAPANLPEHYHGTFIASLVAEIVMEAFGETVSDKIRILPVKVLSDHAATTAIRDGYRGIEYAVNMGADIICCAWSGGSPSDQEKEIIHRALLQNILIIGSAGNTNQENVDLPASLGGVCSVASVDSLLRKTKDSNYGMRIDLSLPGENVRAAYPVADNAWFYGRGTSAAAGLATGCAAVLKALLPEAPPREITEALKNTAVPLDGLNPSYCGKLGSGLPDLGKAVSYLLNPAERHTFFDGERPEGTLCISSKSDRDHWHIRPRGAYRAITIIPENVQKRDQGKKLRLFAGDSLFFEGTIDEMKGGLSLPGSEATIRLISKRKKDIPSNLNLNYFVQTIDSASLYCSGMVNITANEGEISDNSEDADYANNCTCSWHVWAPDSERIVFYFSEFDTEAQVDFVWLFDGYSSNPENVIAKFSGSALPPSVTSRTNRVKVWFVTDSRRTAGGWKLHFRGSK